jgi:hypothetical protein
MVLHVIRGVQRAARVQSERLRGDDLRGERYVCRDDEVARRQCREDARIGDVESGRDLPRLDERRSRHAQRMIGYEHGTYLRSFGGAKQDFLDWHRAGIGVYPNHHDGTLVREIRARLA